MGELEDKLQAQKDYCKEKELPHFAPSSGVCWNCKKQIYNRISLEKAGTDLVTGCPYCHRSYCD